jgi:hypothetical protein
MLDDLNFLINPVAGTTGAPIVDRWMVKGCHIYLPDTPKPVSAICYNNLLYSYVKLCPNLEAAQRAAGRLMERGNRVVLTQVPKGLVLWVLEVDAKIA